MPRCETCHEIVPEDHVEYVETIVRREDAPDKNLGERPVCKLCSGDIYTED